MLGVGRNRRSNQVCVAHARVRQGTSKVFFSFNITSLRPLKLTSQPRCRSSSQQLCRMWATTFALAGCLASSVVAGTIPVWPLPVTYSNGSSVLWIDPGVRISYNGVTAVGAHSVTSLCFALTSLLRATAAMVRSPSMRHGRAGL